MTVALRLELPPPVKPSITVTPEMLAAGRTAFLRNRKLLDDLWDFFDDDLAAFLCAIFIAMHKRHLKNLN